MEDAFSNINVSLQIPSKKVMAAAMDVFEQYQPIVEDALKEAREKLLFDKDFQEVVKEKIKETVQDVMERAIKKAAEDVVRDAYYKNSFNIEKTVSETLMGMIERNSRPAKD